MAIVVERVEMDGEHEMEDSMLAFPGPALRPSARVQPPTRLRSCLRRTLCLILTSPIMTFRSQLTDPRQSNQKSRSLTSKTSFHRPEEYKYAVAQSGTEKLYPIVV